MALKPIPTVNLRCARNAYVMWLPYMTSAEKGGGVKKCSKCADKQYRFSGQTGREEIKKIPKLCGRLIWKPLTYSLFARGTPLFECQERMLHVEFHYAKVKWKAL